MATIASATTAIEHNQVLFKKIKRAFEAFDLQNNQSCDVREIGTIIRSLNVYPSESQLQGWIKEMQETESSDSISFSTFSRVVMKILNSSICVRDDDEKLYRAFQVLDTEKRGFLMPDELRSLLTQQGEVFSHEEVEEMLTACTDPVENKVYYEDYVATF
ncbi:hypothetical protein BATDEDRAFT_28387 [Batrachochytrium dendrobatidis JAM81]|uniref:EF-hand domain-containing protein n=1 Tax=Batrachochytrium dendrobatidis (strain JAM81 / FGSC 10211) TaxID=684364 RepID=F4PDV2_BATDJ|nr:uncharacterized protein BATDEDRAFT_28387 [Batrachochytrium dendrobatidis JAM81]EGF76563.1 hypothetical protein BATDEDRAFT_28387 [Batrachochytrium dendrobatidis JAM81]KAJ8324907.1 hypothetical protein O5D80_006437 [Batrachochytrium dendrobatidis]KAK5672693.1 hypothetical protein QVD99_000201 [Batrachochytrium dendrobatidis]|eukprot:XP_006682796.1 hypothetical protein BATDEDRAFT_28387 [Batrachochytrium dendrobatidis JAM81]